MQEPPESLPMSRAKKRDRERVCCMLVGGGSTLSHTRTQSTLWKVAGHGQMHHESKWKPADKLHGTEKGFARVPTPCTCAEWRGPILFKFPGMFCMCQDPISSHLNGLNSLSITLASSM